jgi:OmpA-OmpF porin, OOP family
VTNSLYTQLSSIIKPSVVTDIATSLGAPEGAVSRGLGLSAASVFSALASKAGDSDIMRGVVDVASRMPTDAMSSLGARDVGDAGSPLMATGGRFLASLFGGGQNWLTDLLSRESGLGSGAASSVLTLGAGALMSFIGSKVRDQGMSAGLLSNFLRVEAPAVRQALPASINDALARHFVEPAMARTAEGVVATTARKERSYFPWMAMAAIIAAGLWYGLRPERAVPPIQTRVVGTSGTTTFVPPDLGNFMSRTLVNGSVIMIPERGVENRLLAFIQDSSQIPDKITWFDFDRLLFDTGSAQLQASSGAQLRDIAAILKAYPNAQVKIGGYTDDVGDPAANLQLSQERADNVRGRLVSMGIDANRLTAEGYGEEHPIADNSTESGRAMNRRISMLVTQK